ncbi:GNAT family N-acetyltransferase [Microbispora sp. NBRC 16548]|uniref:GNAT family N-acetyltransferase n=1 Tax=Microbispora sp. NBRC 16548 TaxID=3030994 RepID=UPI0016134DAF|nr:GNAT family N-acetyltransferase [Microbispora sp. NBRC 16548]GLX06656.1 hypothetical protein Misp03_35830 [Microbispora sp. NBRC 16548]
MKFVHALGDAAEAALTGDHAEVYAAVYALAYAEPPYHQSPLFSPARFMDRTRVQAGAYGFELVTAVASTGDVAGFSFGLTFPAGRWWAGKVSPPPAQVLHSTKMAVIELVLLPEYRRQGHGHQLLNEVLSRRPEPYAMLTAHPEAPAHALYLRWGWEIVGTCQGAADAPKMDVMVLDLTRQMRRALSE